MTDRECPLCMNDIAEDERDFRPCKCGFTICLWCFHTIVQNADDSKPKCPHCRRTYPKTVMQMQPLPQRDRKKKVHTRPSDTHPLAEVCLRSSTGLYVTGLPEGLTESQLRQHYLFGQYGGIREVRVKKTRGLTAAHLEYRHPEEVKLAIRCVDGLIFHGNELSAAHAITRYCSCFLAKEVCHKEQCMDMHFLLPEDFHIKDPTTSSSLGERQGSTPIHGGDTPLSSQDSVPWPKGVSRENVLPSVAELHGHLEGLHHVEVQKLPKGGVLGI